MLLTVSHVTSATINFLLGVFVGNDSPNHEDEAAFLTERHCLTDLLEGLKLPCPCGISHNAWALSTVVQASPSIIPMSSNFPLLHGLFYCVPYCCRRAMF